MDAPPPPASPAPSAAPPPKPRRWLRRLLFWTFLVAFLLAGAAILMVWQKLRASLPLLDGDRPVAGLAAPVRIDRDAHGVPTIRAQTKNDLMLALGFLHAQDRFFQMDLLRRSAAGELSELLGPVGGQLVDFDKDKRLHRFRHRCQKAYAALKPHEKPLVDAYAAGVNAGLASLKGKPFEYIALDAEPTPWKPEDSFLVVAAMFLSLQTEIWHKESVLAAVTDLYPPAVSRWLGHPSDEWDAPLQGGPLPLPPLPTPEEFDLRREPGQQPGLPPLPSFPPTPSGPLDLPKIGSNSWALAGPRSAVGPLLCNDMHLELRLPAIWYRACFIWPSLKEQGKELRAVGVTLPGGPALVVGSNGHVAWGFTNSQADWADLILLQSAKDPNAYVTPDGARLYESRQEIIKVRGGPDVLVNVIECEWGPLLPEGDHKNRQRALRWVAHDPECLNLKMVDLMDATTLEAALSVANRVGGPHQNFVAVDKDGRIGWTILGRIPKRIGFDGRTPQSWADGRCRWAGYWPPDEAPRIVNPLSGQLWTANNRLVEGASLEKLGFGDYDRGARAKQIRDYLLGLSRANYDDMLRLQLDDRALFLARWRLRLLTLLNDANVKGSPGRARYRDRVKDWGGRAAADSVGYRLVHGFRTKTAELLLNAMTARCRTAKPGFEAALLPQPEGIVWRLLTEQPRHLLPPKFQNWEELQLKVVDAQLAELEPRDPELTASVWGEINRPQIRHPLAVGMGYLGRWLEAPNQPLPGSGRDLPRVQGPGHGASQRLAVSPGKEEQGYFHMPGGQSGHPLSPWFLDSYEAWAKGEKTPLLPGETKHTLTLTPGE